MKDVRFQIEEDDQVNEKIGDGPDTAVLQPMERQQFTEFLTSQMQKVKQQQQIAKPQNKLRQKKLNQISSSKTPNNMAIPKTKLKISTDQKFNPQTNLLMNNDRHRPSTTLAQKKNPNMNTENIQNDTSDVNVQDSLTLVTGELNDQLNSPMNIDFQPSIVNNRMMNHRRIQSSLNKNRKTPTLFMPNQYNLKKAIGKNLPLEVDTDGQQFVNEDNYNILQQQQNRPYSCGGGLLSLAHRKRRNISSQSTTKSKPSYNIRLFSAQQYQQRGLTATPQMQQRMKLKEQFTNTTLEQSVLQQSIVDATWLPREKTLKDTFSIHLLDDTDHFDEQGLHIRRNKMAQEQLLMAQVKHVEAIALLKMLKKFDKLAEKLRQKQPWNYQSQEMPSQQINIVTQAVAATHIDELNGILTSSQMQSLREGQQIYRNSLSNSKQGRDSSVEQIPAKEELDLFVEDHNKGLMLKFTEQKLLNVAEEVTAKIHQLERRIKQKEEQILKAKYANQSSHINEDYESNSARPTRLLRSKVLLLISQLKKSIYEELQTQPMEKEPFQDPLVNILREGFHKPVPIELQPGDLHPQEKKKTRLNNRRESQSTGRPLVNITISPREPNPLQTVDARAEAQQVEDIPKTVLYEDQAESKGNADKLRDKIASLEAQLRQKTDRCLSTGECQEMVIDYRRYETAKVDQFQDLVRKFKERIQIENIKEVNQMLKERKALQIEAYRLANIMQKKIDDAVKVEANQLMKQEQQ